MKTDVPFVLKPRAGVIVNTNEIERNRIMKARQEFIEKQELQSQINSLTTQVSELTKLVQRLIDKD